MPFKFRLVFLRNEWKSLGPITAAKLYRLIDEYGQRVVDTTRMNILLQGLWETGYMYESVQWHKYPSGKGGAIIVGAEYAMYHEYGTIFVMRRPFLGPAIDETNMWWENELRRIMEDPFRND